MRIELALVVLEGTPAGERYIFDILEVRFEGERMRARLKGRAAGDWGIAGPDGTFTLDVRFTLETDDGALIYVQYNGRCDVSQGIENPGPVYSTPRFETGDPRYAWLNKVQAVQKGKFDPAAMEITYQVHEVR